MTYYIVEGIYIFTTVTDDILYRVTNTRVSDMEAFTYLPLLRMTSYTVEDIYIFTTITDNILHCVTDI